MATHSIHPETQLWADAQYQWALGFAEALVQCGVTHVVVSPGSRSTPMVLALEKTQGLKTTVVLDERSASFMALGFSKTGSTAAFLCTSGTATTHAFAAMWEAKESRIPMVVITADRPPRLRGKGASQTIDQVGMFGSASVSSFDVTEPLGAEYGLDLGQECVSKAVNYQGPIHVNIGFDKPFEPSTWEPLGDETSRDTQHITRLHSIEHKHTAERGVQDHIESFMAFAGERPVLCLGPVQGFHHDASINHALNILSAKIPTLSDTGGRAVSSILYGCSTAPAALRPSSILWVDRAPYSPSLLDWMEKCRDEGVRLIQCSWNGEVCEPFDFEESKRKGFSLHTLATWIHDEGASKNGKLRTWLDSLSADWLDQWKKDDIQITKVLKDRFDTVSSSAETQELPSDKEAIHAVLKAVPSDYPIMVGNSMIPRDVTSMQPLTMHPWVITQRGVAGIDGNISTAIGIGLGFKKPLVCIVGDCTMLHDMTALLSAGHCSHPLVIIVINNGGGKIFDTLPIAQQDPNVLNTYFTTPQRVDLERLTGAFESVDYAGIQNREALSSIHESLKTHLSSTQGGLTLVEIQTNGKQSL